MSTHYYLEFRKLDHSITFNRDVCHYYITYDYFSDIKAQLTLHKHGKVWAPILLLGTTNQVNVYIF